MNPETKLDTSSIQALHDKYMFPCVSNYYEDPLPLAHGKGMYLTDLDGTDYLDFFGGILTVSVGHCNEHVNASLHRQIDTLQHTSTLYPTAPMVNLAKKLADITPGDLEKCFFACSGSEADETAVHLARIATERDEIIALRHGYSGRTELTMNLTAHAPWRRAGSSIGYIKHAHNAYCYRCPFGLSYPNCDLQCAQDIEELIQTTTSGEPAAFLAEPIQGVGGFITPPRSISKSPLELYASMAGSSSLTKSRPALAGPETSGAASNIGTWSQISSPSPKGLQTDSLSAPSSPNRRLRTISVVSPFPPLEETLSQLQRLWRLLSTWKRRTSLPMPRYRETGSVPGWRFCRRNTSPSETSGVWA